MFGLSHFDVSVPGEGYYLEPQGMVRVISQETVKLPADISGYALVKNGLSNLGILAINTGIIDPTWDGPVSSVLINFGKEPFLLKPGATFMRVTFHEFQPKLNSKPFPPSSRADYLERTKEEVRLYSSPTFLNLHKTAEFAGELAFGKFKKWLIVWAGAIALLLGLLAVLAPIAASYADRAIAGREGLENKVRNDESKISALEQEVDSLKASKSGAGVSKIAEPLHRSANK
jgi:hypothetical protein